VSIALSMWWTVGWVAGAIVVLLVAALIVTIVGLARKVDGVARDLVSDLDSIARKTRPLQDVGTTNVAVQRITRSLRAARGETPVPNRYRTSPGWRE
jgi:hypothetical protein